MIEQIVSQLFKRIGHTWLLDSGFTAPSEKDVQQVLDEAVRMLYDRPIGTQFQTGGLIIEKAPDGYDVHCFVGNYK